MVQSCCLFTILDGDDDDENTEDSCTCSGFDDGSQDQEDHREDVSVWL